MCAQTIEDARRTMESSRSPWMFTSFRHFAMGDRLELMPTIWLFECSVSHNNQWVVSTIFIHCIVKRYAFLSIDRSIDLPTYLLIYLSICLSIYLSLYPSIYLYLSIYLPTYLSILLSHSFSAHKGLAISASSLDFNFFLFSNILEIYFHCETLLNHLWSQYRGWPPWTYGITTHG
jgi:hypothetical protein